MLKDGPSIRSLRIPKGTWGFRVASVRKAGVMKQSIFGEVLLVVWGFLFLLLLRVKIKVAGD